MPLPPADCPRQASHQRSITVSSFARSDGLWDLEGHLTDIWPQAVHKAGGTLPGGEPMHEMWLRLTLDRSVEHSVKTNTTTFETRWSRTPRMV